MGEAQHYVDTRDDEYVHDGSIKAQLDNWHANRGNKSFLRAMIPSPHGASLTGEKISKNPITLMRMVSLRGWLYFFSVRLPLPSGSSRLIGSGLVRLDVRRLRFLRGISHGLPAG